MWSDVANQYTGRYFIPLPLPPPKILNRKRLIFCDTREIFMRLFNIVRDYFFHTLIVSVPKKKRAVLLSSGEGEPSKRNNARCLSVCHQVSPLLPSAVFVRLARSTFSILHFAHVLLDL